MPTPNFGPEMGQGWPVSEQESLDMIASIILQDFPEDEAIVEEMLSSMRTSDELFNDFWRLYGDLEAEYGSFGEN